MGDLIFLDDTLAVRAKDVLSLLQSGSDIAVVTHHGRYKIHYATTELATAAMRRLLDEINGHAFS